MDDTGIERWLALHSTNGVVLVLAGDEVPDISGKVYRIDGAVGTVSPDSPGSVLVSIPAPRKSIRHSTAVVKPMNIKQFPTLRWV